jgi:hypothetical protein
VATLHSGGLQLPGTFSNQFLAHLQVAAAARFREGKGFFLTTTGTDADGAEVTHCHWLHPSIPLTFRYDVRDGSDNRVAPVMLDHKEIDNIAEAMELPNGVRGNDGVWWPFAEPL